MFFYIFTHTIYIILYYKIGKIPTRTKSKQILINISIDLRNKLDLTGSIKNPRKYEFY